MANICIMNGYVSLLFCGLASDIAMDDTLQYWNEILLRRRMEVMFISLDIACIPAVALLLTWFNFNPSMDK